MTSKHSHKAIVFGSISIDKIVNKHGSFPDVLGGSAAYALLANQSNTCELVGVVGDDFPNNHYQLLSNNSLSTKSLYASLTNLSASFFFFSFIKIFASCFEEYHL